MLLACVVNPEAAQKVQEELDDMVGNGRLPRFADRENLLYTNAFVLEVLRWHSTVPTVIHVVGEDDIYDDYLIPKGSIVAANIWNMLHDAKIYPDPFSYKPERFLGPHPQRDSRDICFGFGRRTCPGRELAEASVFITATMSLTVFDITKTVVDGVAVEPKIEHATGAISHPKPFVCSIKPRSQKTVDLISEEAY
ncbi:cytochrome P450 [Gymnopilus junonius]|uniref:Cytochrome P450 n=1 Tax=Gymnopilus junonius TaxID=109634 RepID=A0A9P5NG17_GYMJU|nr:cytochrome P450 [Gymnopilus junonius]